MANPIPVLGWELGTRQGCVWQPALQVCTGISSQGDAWLVWRASPAPITFVQLFRKELEMTSLFIFSFWFILYRAAGGGSRATNSLPRAWASGKAASKLW